MDYVSGWEATARDAEWFNHFRPSAWNRICHYVYRDLNCSSDLFFISVGKKTSKRNKTLYKAQVLTDQDQRTESQTTHSLVYQSPQTPAYQLDKTVQTITGSTYTPNSTSDSLEYYFPLPQDTPDDKIKDSPQQTVDTTPKHTQITQVKASVYITRSPSPSESSLFFG